MIFLTTTAHDVDEELLNRCIVLTVNEEREQTQAIHASSAKRSTTRRAVGTAGADQSRAAAPQRAAVAASSSGGQQPGRRGTGLPDHLTRTRRDHMKLLTLINAIALLHQYQRAIKTDTRTAKTLEYIEATAEDVKLARELMRRCWCRRSTNCRRTRGACWCVG